MNAHQRTYRSRIPKIAAVVCALALTAGYLHFQTKGRLIPGGSSKDAGLDAAPTTADDTPKDSAQPDQSVFPDSRRAPMFPSSKIGVISIDPPVEQREFFGGSKSAEIFDSSDLEPQIEPATSQPQTEEDAT